MWTFQVPYPINSYGVALADITGDDSLEILFTTEGSLLYCLEHNGIYKWDYETLWSITASPAIADIDLDGWDEILIGTSNADKLYCINHQGGWVWWLCWTAHLASTVNDPVVGDIDNDGCLEIVVGTYEDRKIYVLDDKYNISDCGSGVEEVDAQTDEFLLKWDTKGRVLKFSIDDPNKGERNERIN